MSYPYGPEKPRGLLRAADIAAKVYQPVPDIYDTDDPGPDTVAAWRVERWGRFAAERGFAYRADAPADDPAVAALRALHFPLDGLGGWCEGAWQGVPFTAYTALDQGAGGSRWPYRFVCAPLSAARTDLVFDQALRAKRPFHLGWYPANAGYRPVAAPVRPKERRGGGLLAAAVGRGVDAIAGLSAPELLGEPSGDWAALASRPYERAAFLEDWAVRGSWLVVFRREPEYGRVSDEELERLLDAFAAVKRLVEPSS